VRFPLQAAAGLDETQVTTNIQLQQQRRVVRRMARYRLNNPYFFFFFFFPPGSGGLNRRTFFGNCFAAGSGFTSAILP
jgi:hypothetical protein